MNFAMQEDMIGSIDFDSFTDLVREHLEGINMAFDIEIEHMEVGSNPDEVKRAEMICAQLRTAAENLRHTIDLAEKVFRIVTKVDGLMGKRANISKTLIVKLFQSTRHPSASSRLSVTLVDGMERYFDFTVGQMARQLQRNLTEEELSWIEASMTVMLDGKTVH
jgi:hypothetical protein